MELSITEAGTESCPEYTHSLGINRLIQDSSDSSGGSQDPLGGTDVIREPSEVTFPTNAEENREGETET